MRTTSKTVPLTIGATLCLGASLIVGINPAQAAAPASPAAAVSSGAQAAINSPISTSGPNIDPDSPEANPVRINALPKFFTAPTDIEAEVDRAAQIVADAHLALTGPSIPIDLGSLPAPGATGDPDPVSGLEATGDPDPSGDPTATGDPDPSGDPTATGDPDPTGDPTATGDPDPSGDLTPSGDPTTPIDLGGGDPTDPDPDPGEPELPHEVRLIDNPDPASGDRESVVVVEVNYPEDSELVITDMLNSGLYDAIDYETEFELTYASTPNDPGLSWDESYGVKNGPGGSNFQGVWNSLGQAGAGSAVTIAVIDTGFLMSHPDKSSNIIAGYDFGENTSNVNPISASLFPETYHGTATAGLIGAATNNGVGIPGAAWDTRVLVYKVADARGSLSNSAITNAINDAVTRGARVINLSLGGPSLPSTQRAAIDRAIADGVVVVASAGNDAQNGNPINFPAAYGPVISVAATTSSGAWANFSTYNAGVDVAAAGSNILSLDSSSYAIWSGTSFSAPYVAAAVGLMLRFNPSLTPAQVSDILTSTASNGSWNQYTGWGRVNVQAAVAKALAPTMSLSAETVTVDQGQSVSVRITTLSQPAATVTASGVPAGVALSGSGTTWYLSGKPTTPGTYKALLRATAKANSSAYTQTSVTIVVKGLTPTLSLSTTSVSTKVGAAVSVKITTSTNPASKVNASSLPPGVTLSGSGSIWYLSGKPTAAGSYKTWVRSTNTADAGATVLSYVTFTVANAPAPSLSLSTTSVSTSVGAKVSVTITTSTNPVSKVNASSLPPGVSLKGSGGTWYLDGRPTKPGTYKTWVRSTNVVDAGATVLTSVSFVVARAQAPNLGLSATSVSALAGTAVSVKISTSTNPPAVINASSLPPGVTLSGSGGTWYLSGKPTKAGTYKTWVRSTNTFDSSATTLTFVMFQITYATPTLTLSAASVNTTTGNWPKVAITLSANPPCTVMASSLPPGITLWGSGTNWYLSGRVTTPGTYKTWVRATSRQDSTKTVLTSVIWNVTRATPTLAFSATTVATSKGASVSVKATTSSSFETVWNASSLPPGVRLSGSGATYWLSGVPTTRGTYKTWVRATSKYDPNGTIVGSVTFVIS